MIDDSGSISPYPSRPVSPSDTDRSGVRTSDNNEYSTASTQESAQVPTRQIQPFSIDEPIASKSSSFTFSTVIGIIKKYFRFIGPGLMLSVGYFDPGNYSTAVAAGAAYEYKLLCSVLVANFFAVFLQTLSTKLGTVTGHDLAQNCHEHLPKWLNLSIYILAETAIIATDVAEVVGTSISLNILFSIPLSICILLTISDVLVVVIAYNPNGSMRIINFFERIVTLFVVLTVACFMLELISVWNDTDWSEVFTGFLPSRQLFEPDGMYLSVAIVGATVMPHSLYLGSGLCQSRLKDYDVQHGLVSRQELDDQSEGITDNKYRPSIFAIDDTIVYSIVELVVSLFTVALFVNSAILIVAGSTLSTTPEAKDADLFSIYDMLVVHLSKAAGIVFALALLFSGESAGIVCTLAGQMVSDGFLNWTMIPWVRRLITRSLAIIPCLLMNYWYGRIGLASTINGSQVILSLVLPFVSAPLIYFTCNKDIMKVPLTTSNDYIPTQTTATPPGPIAYDRLSTSEDNEITYSVDLPRTQNQSEYDLLRSNDPLDDQYSASIATDRSAILPISDSESLNDIQYKDMSNGKFMMISSIIAWALISFLNLYLIGSTLFG